MLWAGQTGAPWRDLLETYGSWSTVYSRFRRWQIAGVQQSPVFFRCPFEGQGEFGCHAENLHRLDAPHILHARRVHFLQKR
ncbi:transposase [Paenibacillus durus]